MWLDPTGRLKQLDQALKHSLSPPHYREWRETGRFDPSKLTNTEYEMLVRNAYMPNLGGAFVLNPEAVVPNTEREEYQEGNPKDIRESDVELIPGVPPSAAKKIKP
jgi:hypothetical protein